MMRHTQLELSTPSFTGISASIETLRLELNNPALSLEEITFLNTLADIYHRLGSNMKIFLTKGFSSFRRSELVLYENKHRSTLREFFSKSNKRPLTDALIPKPAVSEKSYKEVVGFLSAWTDYDFSDFMKKLNVTFDDTAESIYDQKNEYDHYLMELELLIDGYPYPRPKLIMEEVLNLFPSVKTAYRDAHQHNESSFKILADNKEDLVGIHEQVLQWNSFFRGIADSGKALKSLDKYLNRLISTVEQRKYSLPIEFLNGLLELTQKLAEIIEGVGIIAEYCQKVEHNYVEALSILVSMEKNK